MSAVEGYASALFEIAKAEGALSSVQSELTSFVEAMGSNANLAQTLNDQSLPADRRLGVVTDLLGGKAHSVTVNLVSLLVGTGRAKELPSIVAAMRDKGASAEGRVAGEVRSAISLSDDQQQRLTSAVSKQIGKPVALTFIVDPSVLGGVVTTVGDTVIDGSIRRRLELMKDAV